MKIITWNYDYQLEKAYNGFYEDNRLDSMHSMLNVCCKNMRCSMKNDAFAVYKLNGSAGFNYLGGFGSSKPFVTKMDVTFIELLDLVIRNYAAIHHNEVRGEENKVMATISFAWEDDLMSKNMMECIEAGTSATTHLVVIGYSFPFFNREIDRRVIQGMNALTEVYIQAPDAESIAERFQVNSRGYYDKQTKSDNEYQTVFISEGFLVSKVAVFASYDQ